MRVPCFTREERDGIHLLFPLEGPKRQNALLVNETAKYVFDRLGEDICLDELADAYIARAPDSAKSGRVGGRTPSAVPSRSELKVDLYRILRLLKSHAICDYGEEELFDLLPQGEVIRDCVQVMPLCAAAEAGQVFAEAAKGSSGAHLFISPAPRRKLNPRYFESDLMKGRHVQHAEVCMLYADARGRVESVCTLVNLETPQPKITTLAALAASTEEFEQRVEAFLSRIAALLSHTTLASILRFQVPTGARDADIHPSFRLVLGRAGFRRSFELENEIGAGVGLAGYDKVLGSAS